MEAEARRCRSSTFTSGVHCRCTVMIWLCLVKGAIVFLAGRSFLLLSPLRVHRHRHRQTLTGTNTCRQTKSQMHTHSNMRAHTHFLTLTHLAPVGSMRSCCGGSSSWRKAVQVCFKSSKRWMGEMGRGAGFHAFGASPPCFAHDVCACVRVCTRMCAYLFLCLSVCLSLCLRLSANACDSLQTPPSIFLPCSPGKWSIHPNSHLVPAVRKQRQASGAITL